MAFTKKNRDPYTLYSVFDEAIDRGLGSGGSLALKRYALERDENAPPKFLFGATPTKFVCRPIPYKALENIEDAARTQGEHGMLTLAFQIGVTAVDPVDVRIVRQPAGWDKDAEMLSDETVEELGEMLGADLIKEIGYVCLQKARLSASKKSPFRLPPGLRVDWVDNSSATKKDTQSSETRASSTSSAVESPRTS